MDGLTSDFNVNLTTSGEEKIEDRGKVSEWASESEQLENLILRTHNSALTQAFVTIFTSRKIILLDEKRSKKDDRENERKGGSWTKTKR